MARKERQTDLAKTAIPEEDEPFSPKNSLDASSKDILEDLMDEDLR